MYNLTGGDFNPLACWDTWGLDAQNYASKQGAQISLVKAIIDALVGGGGSAGEEGAALDGGA